MLKYIYKLIDEWIYYLKGNNQILRHSVLVWMINNNKLMKRDSIRGIEKYIDARAHV